MKTMRTGLMALAAFGAIASAMAQGQPESQFLGVRLLDDVRKVMRMFGNPIEVNFQQSTVGGPAQNAPGGMGGAAREDGMGGGGGLSGPAGGPPGMSGGMGGFGGGAPAAADQSTARLLNMTSYTYRVKGGYTYVFLVGQGGKVIQISAYGLKHSPSIRTQRGIGLGSTYKQVIDAYGYPTDHEFAGDTYTVRYYRTNVAFTFDPKTQKVISITMALGMRRSMPGQGGMAAGGGPGGAGAPGAPGATPGRAGAGSAATAL